MIDPRICQESLKPCVPPIKGDHHLIAFGERALGPPVEKRVDMDVSFGDLVN